MITSISVRIRYETFKKLKKLIPYKKDEKFPDYFVRVANTLEDLKDLEIEEEEYEKELEEED